jgi:hypothetical protein
MRAVGEQGDLHQAAALLDALHQAGTDNIDAGGGVLDRAQCFAQRVLWGGHGAILLLGPG